MVFLLELLLKLNKSQKNFFLFLILFINSIAAVYGFIFYYGFQLMNNLQRAFLLPFIPDSPLSVVFLIISFIFVALNLKNVFINAFNLFAFISAQKIAVWTLIVLIAFNDYYASIQGQTLTLILWIAHLLLFLEAFLLVGKINFSRKAAFFSLFLLLLHDFIDFSFNVQPPLPKNSNFSVFLLSLTLSVFFVLFSYFILKKLRKPIIEIF